MIIMLIILCGCTKYTINPIIDETNISVSTDDHFNQSSIIANSTIANPFFNENDTINTANSTGIIISNLSLYRVKSDYELNISEDKLYSCENDSDCMAVSGCCGCNGGGELNIINVKYIDEWNSYQKQNCKMISCIAVMSQHISCFSEPKCVNNLCTSIPNKEYLCGSLLFSNCKEYTPQEKWDEIRASNGISCRKVMDICE